MKLTVDLTITESFSMRVVANICIDPRMIDLLFLTVMA